MGDLQEWADAIEAITDPPKGRKSDVRALGRLLRSGQILPAEIREILAELIDPKLPISNVTLVPKKTLALSRSLKRSFASGKVTRGKRTPSRSTIAFEMSRQLKVKSSVERAVMEVAARLGVSEKWVFTCWTPLSRAYPNVFGNPNRKKP